MIPRLRTVLDELDRPYEILVIDDGSTDGTRSVMAGLRGEHVQAFTVARLRATLGARFDDVRVVRAFPWLIAEARRPRSGAR